MFLTGTPKVLVLALALAASLLELGPIAAVLQNGGGILPTLLAGLAYQVGNVAPRPSRGLTKIIVALLSVVGVALMLVAPIGSTSWLGGIAAMSWVLQTVRRSIVSVAVPTDLPSTLMKRTARVIGFIMATLAPLPVWLICVFIVTVTAIFERGVATTKPTSTLLRHPLEWIMVVHQTHYFAYAYAVPVLLLRPELGGIPLIGLWFALGWISYLLAESLWPKLPPRAVFVAGHIGLTIVLLLLSVSEAMAWPSLTLWVLSGFGGGTVYCITLLHKNAGLPHEYLERAEDIGHLAGVGLAIACVVVLNWSATALPAVGSLWALAAALAMLTMIAPGSRGAHSQTSYGDENASQ